MTSPTPSVAIIGHTGFVGSYLRDMVAPGDVALYNSKNIGDIRGRHYDTVYCAGISATKWLANKHPDADWASISALIECLCTVHVRERFVLISTIDVYPDVSAGWDEAALERIQASEWDGAHPHAYGKHRYEAERALAAHFGDAYRCLRLCGLFGYGLKKNPIYDVVVAATRHSVDGGGSYQWYCMHEWFEHDVRAFLASGARTRNLFTEPVTNEQLAEVLQCRVSPSWTAGPAYHCTTGTNGGPYVRSAHEVRCALERYVRHMRDNALVVSTLASPSPALMRAFGVRELEVAPCQVFGNDWFERMPSTIEAAHRYARESGPVYSLQGVFYGTEALNIFTAFDATLAHTRRVVDLAAALGARVVVFGAPAVRRVPEGYAEHERTAVAFFRAVADYMPTTLTLCIEPNARAYGCNFLTTSAEGRAFVLRVDRPNIRLMLDTGCMALEESDAHDMPQRFAECAEVLAHVHFSAPHLHSLAAGRGIPYVWLRTWLRRRVLYRGRITLEVLDKAGGPALRESLLVVTRAPRVCVVGGGWYGCHAARVLRDAVGLPSVTLYERSAHLFGGASRYNQNRLHLGYHYPRSYDTRYMCKENYAKFMRDYAPCTRAIERNWYAVADESVVDKTTYAHILRASGLPVRERPTEGVFAHCQAAFATDERFVCPNRARRQFEDAFAGDPYTHLVLSHCFGEHERADWDVVIDCTNNEWSALDTDCVRDEPTLSLLYRRTKHTERLAAWTVMDGPFPSLYPFDADQQLYSLTHVTYTAAGAELSDEKRALFERAAARYIPCFRDEFEYAGHFVSKKAKRVSPCASRMLATEYRHNGVVSFSCGKITGIYDMADTLRALLAYHSS